MGVRNARNFPVGANIGKIALIPSWLDCANISRSVARISIDESKNSTSYYYYYLEGSIKHLISKTIIGGAQPVLNLKDIQSLAIPIPPVLEQKKIAEILSAWDLAIEQTRKLIDAKKRLKKGMMQQLLTGRIRFSNYVSSNNRIKSHFYEYPSDWEHPQISQIANEVSERNMENNKHPVLSCSKYEGFVNSLEYFGKKVYSDNTSNYKIIKKGQFGFPSNHVEEGSIGLLKHVLIGIVSPIYTVFKTNPNYVFAPYLYRLFKTSTYQHVFSINTNASVDRRGNLRWKEFSKIRIPLPTLAEQMRISTVLDACDCEIDHLSHMNSALKTQKKGLMQKLLTGEVRIK
jgi:type I restriction enzyme S subunit